jgi:hypothetical protein
MHDRAWGASTIDRGQLHLYDEFAAPGSWNDMTEQFDLRKEANEVESLVSQSFNDEIYNPIAYSTTTARLSCEFGKMTPQQVREVLQQMDKDESAINNIPVIMRTDTNASGELAGVQFRQSFWKGDYPPVYANVTEKFCAIIE